MKDSVRVLQELIVQNGYTIAIDGLFGKQTSTAIERLCVPNWVKTAMKEVGTQEIRGMTHNDRVLEYHSVTGGYSNDEVPWCGSFVAWVLNQNNMEFVRIGERAKSWLTYGKTSNEPVVGSIAVKSRVGGGHVCFVVGKNMDGDLYCLGGNQNNEVNIQLYKREVFLDFRVPSSYSKESLPYYALYGEGNVNEA